MTFIAFIGFTFGLIAYAEVYSLKKRVAMLEAERGTAAK